MRLTGREIALIHQALKSFIGSDYQLRLYGSRLDDSAKGGDIDLLLIVPQQELNRIQSSKHLLLVAIKNHIGEQKIDLTITHESQIASDAFLKTIFDKSQPI